MDIYAFANQKGGVGKTTVTLGVGAALAGSGRRVLLIDLDPQASATKVLGVDVEERCTVADTMLEPKRFPLERAIVETSWGFDLAPAETALASREARRATADEFVLRDQLASVGDYDAVLIDCPPSLGVLTLNALTAATHLVLVTEPSFLALQGIEELLRTRDLVQAHYNSRLKLSGVIVNRVERTVEHRGGLAELLAYFGEELIWLPHLPKRTVLQEGARRGVSHDALGTAAARELSHAFAQFAEQVGGARVGG
jgi:chromosome partitioning protein